MNPHTQPIDEDYSTAEEIAHAVTHGVGALLSIAGLAVLVTFSALYGDAWHIVSSSIYGFTLILLYTASTLYHAITKPNIKDVLKKLDHAIIFLLIAGTYTPFTLVSLNGAWGWSLFGIVWSIAIAGMVMELAVNKRRNWLSLSLYLGLGWVIVRGGLPPELMQMLPERVQQMPVLSLAFLLFVAGAWALTLAVYLLSVVLVSLGGYVSRRRAARV